MVGEQERQNGTVNVRTRDNVVHGMFTLADVAEVLRHEKGTRSLTSSFEQFKAQKQGGSGGGAGGGEGGDAAANGAAQ